MSDHELIFREPAEVRGTELPVTGGALPDGLRGTLLRSGPGRQHAGATPVHFLDGYAFTAAARFEAGRVVYHARHVDLPQARADREAGRLVRRRPFTNRPGGRLANLLRLTLTTGGSHDVYPWGGAVVASDVDGHYLLDAVTLDTAGPAPINALGGGLTQLAAMPRFDTWSGRLVAFTMTPGLVGSDTIAVVELDAQWQEQARVVRSLGIKGALLHDLAATEGHYLVVQFGRLDVGAAAGGGGPLIFASTLPAGGARVLAIPRRGDGPIRSLPLPEGHQTFHIANAYEADGRLVVDTTIYEGALDFRDLYPPPLRAVYGPSTPSKGPFLARHTLDLGSGAHEVVVHRAARGEAASVREDLQGRRHRYAYVSSPGTRGDEPGDFAYYWYHGLAKLDCDAGTTVSSWDAGPRVFVTAPQFVARGAAEDDGWVLAWTHDAAADRGELVVLDAADLARGPVARLALPGPLPPASHVGWMAS